MKTTKVFVDKIYKLSRDVAPLSYILASQHSRRFPLLHFDEETGINRPLRYARNQKSAFEDEQDGNAILEPIIFEDGFLSVTKNNQVLQQFLHLHPGNGGVFVEVDKEKDAQEVVDIVQREIDALILANELSLERKVSVARVLFENVDRMSSAEIKRDILLFARNQPLEFLEVVNDPDLEIESNISEFISSNLLGLTDKSVTLNTGKTSKKILSLPFGEDPMFIISSWMKSDEGLPTYKMLVKKLQ
jgi:hypothetical protein|tara:strand:+ start:209 stop:946 length:738 start_codon:yes stop_codon:yes gene_type:complete